MSKKQKADANVEKIEQVRARMLATISFVESLYEFPSGEAFRSAVEKAASEKNLRTLQLLAREIDAMATVSLPPHERDGLDAMLRHQLGVERERERSTQAERALVAIKRGSIASEVERRHLEDYAEMLEASGEDPENLSAVRRLLRGG